MAEIAASYFVSRVASRLSTFLAQETLVVSQVRKQVEWIEKELRLMQAFLEHHERRGYNEEEGFDELAEELQDIARDAADVIETFTIKSDKKRRAGVLYLLDRYDVGKEQERISERMRDIAQRRMSYEQTSISVAVETPGETSSSSATAIAALAVEKLDHILSQNIITGDEMIGIVEQVKDELGDLQNIVSNTKSTSQQREYVWLDDVKDVCNYTAHVAGNFIARREKWLRMGRVKKVFYLYEGYASAWEFKNQMEYTSTQIGDALYRWFTFGFGVGGKDMRDKIGSRVRPHPSLSLRRLIVVKVPFFAVNYALLPLLCLWFLVLTIDFVVSGGSRTDERKPEPKKGKTPRWLQTFLYFDLIDFLVFVLFYVLTLELVAVLQLGSVLYSIVLWAVSLWRSMGENLKSTRRYLALMRAFLSDSESAEGLNKRQKVWVDQLGVAAQNGQFLIAACPEGKGGFSIISRIKFAEDVNHLLNEILDISDRKTIYVIANIQEETGRKESLSMGPSMQESESESENIVEHSDNSGGAEEHDPLVSAPATSSHRPDEKVQSMRGEMQLMDALFQDAQEIGELDGRSKIWVDQMGDIAREMETVLRAVKRG